ncbi:hypothetical protein, partial [Streptomyces sp. NPDC012746]
SEIGGAGADFAVTGDHLYGLNPDRTAVYEWNGTGTDWTKIGGPAQDLEAGGAGLFATSRDGKLHKYDGRPDTWSEIGGAGADFAVTGDHLYGLNPDRTAVYEWNGQGTDWTKIGGPAQDLHAGGAGLFATSRDGKIHHYSGQPDRWAQAGEPGKAFTASSTHLYGLAPDGNSVHQWSGQGTAWTSLGAPSTPASPTTAPQPTEKAPPAPSPEPADQTPPTDEDGPEGESPEPVEAGDAALAMAVTAKDDLYTLTPDHSALWRRSGSRWEQISGPAGSVYAGRAGAFITRPGTNTQISKYNDETRAWEPIVEANGSFAVTGDHLYHLTAQGIGQWDGADWTVIGGPAKNIYAGGAGIFATNPKTGHIYKYDGKPNHWTEIGGPGATFASGHDRLYAIAPDHSAVYEWSGRGTEWTRIGGPAKNIYAGGAGLFATNLDTGHIYKYNGKPDQWTEIGGPGATFTVSDTQLYGLTPDRSATYRWDGAAGWTRIGGPENAAEREEEDRLLRESCQPAGRDCVKELRDAEKILETSLTDWLKDNSLEYLLDTFDINDIRKCAADTDLNSCLTVLLDAGSVILGIGAYKKAKNALDKTKGLQEFAGKAKEARDTYNDLRKIIDTARKAKENLPEKEEQQRQEPCLVDRGSTGATASAYTAFAMRSTVGAGMLRTGSGGRVQSAAADDADGCGPYIWVPFRPGVDDTPQGDIPADMGEASGAFLRPGEYIFIVRLDGSLRAVHVDDMRAVNGGAGHTSLAERKPVIMAGEFVVGPGGVFTRIENYSGHYMPLDREGFTPLKDVTRAAFLAHGWVFSEKAWVYYPGPK